MLSYRWRGVRGLRHMPVTLPAPQSRRPVARARASLRKGLGFRFQDSVSSVSYFSFAGLKLNGAAAAKGLG